MDDRSLALGSFLISILSDASMRGVSKFGVLMPADSSPSDISLDTSIFARLLKGVWSVTVDNNIDGSGRSGWAFARES